MEHTPHTTYTRIMLLILALVLLSASITGYFVSQRMQSSPKGTDAIQITTAPKIVPTLIPYPTKGSFVLKEQSMLQSVKLGMPVVIDLIATSSTDTVAGYDAILSYDESAFERQSVQNKVDSFRIFTYDRTTHLSISATKNLQVSEQIRFSSTPILTFTFLAKKKGTYIFSLKPVGNESSKLVNESAQVTYPESNDFRLEIN
ncbi:MAG: hypothetical protein V1922_05920 [bacterium]